VAEINRPTVHPFGVAVAQLEFRGKQRKFWLHNTNSGLATAQEVLAGKSYPVLSFMKKEPRTVEVRTIVDVGANIGASVLYFASYFPDARIVAFEPFGDSYELLRRNTEDLPNVSALNVGLYDRDARMPMEIGTQDSVTNSVARSCLAWPNRSVDVELREAGAALRGQGLTTIDILKLDTEGCELPILRALAGLFGTTAVIYVEWHSEADRWEIDRMLAPTHSLYRGTVHNPHRGEFCYVLRDRVPADVHEMAITLSTRN
jgi:FkbM family methyltransferase